MTPCPSALTVIIAQNQLEKRSLSQGKGKAPRNSDVQTFLPLGIASGTNCWFISAVNANAGRLPSICRPRHTTKMST